LRPFPHVEGVEHRWVEANGVRMHVAEAGSGPPIVLLHGWPQHWYLWRAVMPALAGEARLIAPDWRGAGWSDAPARGYEKETLADDFFGLLDALELGRVSVAAHDWGGWAALLAAIRGPERFDRLLVLNVAHPFRRFEPRLARTAWRFWYMWINAFLGARLMHGSTWTRLALTAGSAGVPEQAAREFAESYREPARARAGMQMYRTFVLREQMDLLRGRYLSERLRVPTRLVFGADDRAIDKRLLEGYEDNADDMRVEFVPDTGHFIVDERPELVVDRMRSFLLG
jgi:pimeloyl-ACP methyl ester carboxylesterase